MRADLDLDHDSPVPLYHQIAESIRYRIATGRLAPGQLLPPVRDAAVRLGVNMHTVRRAYGELAASGLLESRGAAGTRVVLALPGLEAAPDPAGFVEQVVAVARERFGLDVGQLRAMLPERGAGTAVTDGDGGDGGDEIVHVVECSESQCLAHAREIAAAWDVDARPWCLGRAGEPPPGPVVATYFHYNDVRQRWPSRLGAVHFVAIHPDPALEGALPRPRGRTPSRVTLCETDASMARNIAADLSAILPPARRRVETRLVEDASEALALAARGRPVLLSPRLWGCLSAGQRARPGVFEVRYVIARDELRRLGVKLGWNRKPKAES